MALNHLRLEGRLVPLWYDFQELRLTRDRLWARLAAVRRQFNLPALRTTTRLFPIYSFVASTKGMRHLVSRPNISGGAGQAVLRCWTAEVAEATVLHAEGEVDLSTASELKAAIRSAFVQNAQNGHVIVDLSCLDYLDISGIHVLERFAVANGDRFVVVGSKPTIHRLFDVLELTDVLPVVPSMEAAREYLRSR